MKKRIFSLCLVILMTFGALCAPLSVFADDAAAASLSEDSFVDEVATNFPNFDVENMTLDSNGSPILIGSMLFPTVDVISIYLFNPRRTILSSFSCSMSMEYESTDSDGARTFKTGIVGADRNFYTDNYSDDYTLWKFSFNFGSLFTKNYEDPDYLLWFFFDTIKFSDPNNSFSIDCFLDTKFCVDEDGSCSVVSTNQKLLSLDVNLTSFVAGNVGADLYTKYEIFSSYFAIPDNYINWYEEFYSATCSFIRKQTSPIVYGEAYNDAILDASLRNELINNTAYYISANTVDHLTSVHAPIVIDPSFTPDSAHTADRVINDAIYWYLATALDENGELQPPSEEQILEYINEYGDGYDLFSDMEKVAQREKTIEDSFEILNYFEQADFNDFWKDFGFTQAVLFWFYENGWDFVIDYIDESVLQKSSEVPDQPCNIFLFTDSERATLQALSDSEISERYLVALEDVPEFKQYVLDHRFTVLYRYDIQPYTYHDLLRLDDSDLDNPDYDAYAYEAIEHNDGRKYAFVEKSMIFDYEVIRLTFMVEDEFIVVPVQSERKSSIGSITPIDPDDTGVTVNPNWQTSLFESVRADFQTAFSGVTSWLGNIGGKIANLFANGVGSSVSSYLDGLFGSAAKIVKPILMVIGVALVIFFLVWVFRSINEVNAVDLLFKTKVSQQKDRELTQRERESDRDFRFRSKEADRAQARSDRDHSFKVSESERFRTQSDRDYKLHEREVAAREKSAAAAESRTKKTPSDSKASRSTIPKHSTFSAEEAMELALRRTESLNNNN